MATFIEGLKYVIDRFDKRIRKLEQMEVACSFDYMIRSAYADLPTTSPTSLSNGRARFVTDGRKAGEGAGAGTGVPAVYSNGAWRRVEDNAAVTV